MGTTTGRNRWADKFREPCADDLVAAITDKAQMTTLELVREQLASFTGATETVQWLGTPWRWSLVYTCELDPTRALAYIVPDPARPQVCVPLTTAMIQAIPMRRLKKPIREGIIYSKVVAGTFWPTWDVTSRSAADEVLDLVTRKHKYVHVGAESVASVV